MADTTRRPIDMPVIKVTGYQKLDSGTLVQRSGYTISGVPTISGNSVTNPDTTYRFTTMVGIELSLGTYPSGIFTLASYSGQENNNNAAGFNRVGLAYQSGKAQILYRLDGKSPSETEGNVYFSMIYLMKSNLNITSVSGHPETFIVDNDVELVCRTFYGSSDALENRIKISLI